LNVVVVVNVQNDKGGFKKKIVIQNRIKLVLNYDNGGPGVRTLRRRTLRI